MRVINDVELISCVTHTIAVSFFFDIMAQLYHFCITCVNLFNSRNVSLKPLTEEIQELNMVFLMLAQRLINEDRYAAIAQMDIDDEQCDAIERLSISNIFTLSKHNQFLFSFNLSPDEIARAVTMGRGSSAMTNAAHLSMALLNKSAKKDG